MDPEKNIPSRRTFLRGAAVTAAAVASAGVLANAVTAPVTGESAEKAKVAKHVKADETIETQVVVVGSGLGGLSAAITAM